MRTSANGATVPATGVVEFRAGVDRVVTPSDGVISPGREKVALEADGTFEIELIATDIGNPADWAWRVLFAIAGYDSPPTAVSVPTGAVVDLNTVVPVADVDGVAVIVGPRGPAGDGALDLDEHINDPSPHPAYDDIPSLVVLFENGLA